MKKTNKITASLAYALGIFILLSSLVGRFHQPTHKEAPRRSVMTLHKTAKAKAAKPKRKAYASKPNSVPILIGGAALVTGCIGSFVAYKQGKKAGKKEAQAGSFEFSKTEKEASCKQVILEVLKGTEAGEATTSAKSKLGTPEVGSKNLNNENENGEEQKEALKRQAITEISEAVTKALSREWLKRAIADNNMNFADMKVAERDVTVENLRSIAIDMGLFSPSKVSKDGMEETLPSKMQNMEASYTKADFDTVLENMIKEIVEEENLDEEFNQIYDKLHPGTMRPAKATNRAILEEMANVAFAPQVNESE